MKKLILFILLLCTIQAVTAQSSCDSPLVASDGENSFTANNSLTTVWLVYTLTSDGKLQVSSNDGIYFDFYTGSCDDLSYKASGKNNLTLFNLSEGDEVYIESYPLDPGANSFEIAVLPIVEGDQCDVSLAAAEGVNTAPTNGNQYFWYNFTMPSTQKKITISSLEDQRITVYTNTCQFLYYDNESYNGILTIADLGVDAEIFIRLKSDGIGDFDWELTLADLEAGDICSLASTATLGVNSVPVTTNLTYLYTYTVPSDGNKLVLSTEESKDVYIYKGSCDNRRFINYGSKQTVATDISEGDEIIVEWITSGSGNFDWTLALEPLENGDKCSLAVTAELGVNNLTSTSGVEYWYSFTMPATGGVLSTSFDNNSLAASVYSGSCDKLVNRGYLSKQSELTNLLPDEEIFIKWRLDGVKELDWTLSIAPAEEGETCLAALEAKLGTNIIPENDFNEYWYSFTMPEEAGVLNINFTVDAYMRIYSNSCDDLDYLSGSYDSLKISSLYPGDEIFIQWYIYNSENLEWDLAIEPFEEGSNCSVPLVASIGDNFSSKAPQWFLFTAPVDEAYTISSVGFTSSDTYLKIYSECEGSLIDFSYNASGLQSELDITLSEDDSLYIYWDDAWSSEAFNWTISVANPLDQTITFAGLETQPINVGSFDLMASSNSNLAIEYSSSDESVATISGSTVTILSIGSTIITASQFGNDNYNPATPVEQTLIITKANQIITFEALEAKPINVGSFDLMASSNSNLAIEYSSSDESVATISGSTVTILSIGSTIITASQSGSDNYNPATPVEQTLTVDVEVTLTSDAELNTEILIYPNPVSSILTINHANIKAGTALWVLDATGVKVLDYKMSTNATKIELDDLPFGIYFIKMEGQQHVLKFIKE